MPLSSKKRPNKYPHGDGVKKKSKYFEDTQTSAETGPKMSSNIFARDCVNAAKSLLGQLLVRNTDKGRITCKIVEVESYMGNDDKASHSYNHKQTKGNEAMFMKPGTLYVYMTYGMYYCMNVSCGGPGDAVLIRAVEPVDGFDLMKENRINAQKAKRKLVDKNLCNGPSKVCQALNITKEMDKLDLTNNKLMWLEEVEPVLENSIVSCKRIGLNERYGEWTQKPLRFYLIGNNNVSVRDKTAENNNN